MLGLVLELELRNCQSASTIKLETCKYEGMHAFLPQTRILYDILYSGRKENARASSLAVCHAVVVLTLAQRFLIRCHQFQVADIVWVPQLHCLELAAAGGAMRLRWHSTLHQSICPPSTRRVNLKRLDQCLRHTSEAIRTSCESPNQPLVEWASTRLESSRIAQSRRSRGPRSTSQCDAKVRHAGHASVHC